MCRAFFVDFPASLGPARRLCSSTELRSGRRVNAVLVGEPPQHACMDQPFIGSEAIASGALERRFVRRYYRAILPNVYLDKRVDPSLRQRTVAAWLWSGREAVVAGLAAAAVHGSKWVDDDATIELIWKNARAPRGVVTRADLLLPGEFERRGGVTVTTAERTAFDLGRRGRIGMAIARLDALAAATRFKPCDVLDLAAGHRHTRGLRQLESALDQMDPGAESPKETWLRLLVIRAGYPRPRTQIPVPKPDGLGHVLPRYGLGGHHARARV